MHKMNHSVFLKEETYFFDFQITPASCLRKETSYFRTELIIWCICRESFEDGKWRFINGASGNCRCSDMATQPFLWFGEKSKYFCTIALYCTVLGNVSSLELYCTLNSVSKKVLWGRWETYWKHIVCNTRKHLCTFLESHRSFGVIPGRTHMTIFEAVETDLPLWSIAASHSHMKWFVTVLLQTNLFSHFPAENAHKNALIQLTTTAFPTTTFGSPQCSLYHCHKLSSLRSYWA